MDARRHLNPVQFHVTADPQAFPAVDWVHLGTHKAASDRAQHVREHYDDGRPLGMVAARIRGHIQRTVLTDSEANQVPYDKWDYTRSEVRPQPPGAHRYVNEFEDPGSMSYIAHKSKVKVIYRGPLK